MLRILGISLFLVGNILGSRAVGADEKPQAGPTVYLTVREPEGFDPKGALAAPMLDRELIRQAFLVAARDELGLATRDVLLREEFPEKPDEKSMPFELFCRVNRVKKDFDVEYFLHRRQGTMQLLWQWVFNVDINNPTSLKTLSEKAEAFSRGELKDVLTKGGWGHPVPAARASSVVPDDTTELLWSWNEISLLAGLRRVHAEIHEKGESPELLAALAIGYVNLGSISEWHYSANSKAYFARALLYAERLMRKMSDSPWAQWHRAYVRTLVGLHNYAADDVAEAKKKQGVATPPKPLPFWTGVIDAFGQGDLPQMLKVAKTPAERRLARYLNLQAVVHGNLDDLTVKVAEDFLKVCPDCPRASNVLSVSGELGTSRMSAYSSFGLMGASLRKRLPDVPGLPEPLAKRLRKGELKGDNDAAEVEFRKELIAELKKAGSPDLDHTEPSLSAVGHTLEEMEFAQLMRRLEFEGHKLGVSSNETIATFSSLCAAHPYAAYIRGYTHNKTEIEAAAKLLDQKLEIPAALYKERLMLQWLYSITPTPRLHGLYQAPMLHSDMVFGDEMRGINAGLAGQPDDRQANRWFMMKSWRTSNKLPLSVAMRISRDWTHARLETDTRERDYADDPLVMHALAERYYHLKRYDDAERCSKRQVEVAPGFPAYRLLANIYKAKEDHANWKKTLDKALTIPASGLEHASIRNEIALDLLERKNYKDAVVYADAAAESYSEWSMMTAARCHEMLGEWKKAEQLVHAVAERYESDMLVWMYWCHRTGHGDLHAADDFARTQIEALGTALYPTQYRDIGHYYQLMGEPEKALVLYQRAYEKGHDPFTGLSAALIADGLGKTADRDTLFQQVMETKLPANSSEAQWADIYRKLIGQFREMLPPKNAKQLNLPELEKVLTASYWPSTLPYFVGVFLKNRGDKDGAKTFLIRCAQAGDWDAINHVLACQLLREMKVKVPAEADASKTAEPAKLGAKAK